MAARNQVSAKLQTEANRIAKVLDRIDIETYYRGNNLEALVDIIRMKIAKAYILGFEANPGGNAKHNESLKTLVGELEAVVKEQTRTIERQKAIIEALENKRENVMLQELGTRLFPGFNKGRAQ